MKKVVSMGIALAMSAVLLIGCSSGGSSSAAASGSGSGSTTDADGVRIAVICKAMDSEFWTDVKKGAEDAAKELGITVDVKAPKAETNVDEQFKIIEDAIQQKYDVLAVAPCDSEGIKPILEDAVAAGIKVITVDTDADSDARTAFVGTDNKMGGQMAAERIAELVKGNSDPKIAMITGVTGQQTMRDRIEGFEQGLKDNDLTLLESQPANSDPGLAMTVMENFLTSHPDLDAVFILNATMAVSALEAAENVKSDVKIVGFDSSTDALQAVKDGKMDSLIAQSPYNMGKYAVENAAKLAKDESVEAVIDTGTELVSKDNVDDYIS